MAQRIVKSIKSEKVPKQFKSTLEDLPEVKKSDKEPKDFYTSSKENKRSRAGHLPGGININGKAKLIGNGNKIK